MATTSRSRRPSSLDKQHSLGHNTNAALHRRIKTEDDAKASRFVTLERVQEFTEGLLKVPNKSDEKGDVGELGDSGKEKAKIWAAKAMHRVGVRGQGVPLNVVLRDPRATNGGASSRTPLEIPPVQREDTTLAVLEATVQEVLYGEPESGQRVGMMPGTNPTDLRWSLVDISFVESTAEMRETLAPGVPPEEKWSYVGHGCRIMYLPSDLCCPSWAEPEGELTEEERAWVEEFEASQRPVVLVDPSEDPLRPLRRAEEWQRLIMDRPWTTQYRRILAQQFLCRKIESGAPAHVELEGLQGLWELTVGRGKDIASVEVNTFRMLGAYMKRSTSPQNMEVAANLVWTLTIAAATRAKVISMGCVQGLLRALKMARDIDAEMAVAELGGDAKKARTLTRDKLIVAALGALSVLVVDKRARRALLFEDKTMDSLVQVMSLTVGDLNAGGGLYIRRKAPRKSGYSFGVKGREDLDCHAAARIIQAVVRGHMTRKALRVRLRAVMASASPGGGGGGRPPVRVRRYRRSTESGMNRIARFDSQGAVMIEDASRGARAAAEDALGLGTKQPAAVRTPRAKAALAKTTPAAEPGTIFKEAEASREGAAARVKGKRRRWAADTLYSCLLRDVSIRAMFAAFEGLGRVTPLLRSPSPHVRFVTSLVLQMYAKDVKTKGLRMITGSGSARVMFDELLVCMDWALGLLKQGIRAVDDGTGAVQVAPICEGAALSVWACVASLCETGSIREDDVAALTRLATTANESSRLRFTPYYLAGCLASCAGDIKAASIMMTLQRAREVAPRPAIRLLLKPSAASTARRRKKGGADAEAGAGDDGLTRSVAAAAAVALARHSLARVNYTGGCSERWLHGPFRHLLRGTLMHRALVDANRLPCSIPECADSLEMLTCEGLMHIYVMNDTTISPGDARAFVELLGQEHRTGAGAASCLGAAAWGLSRAVSPEGSVPGAGRQALLDAGGLGAVVGLAQRHLGVLQGAALAPLPGGADEPALVAVHFLVGAAWMLLLPESHAINTKAEEFKVKGLFASEANRIVGVRLKDAPKDPKGLSPGTTAACKLMLEVARLPSDPALEDLRRTGIMCIWACCHCMPHLRAAFIAEGVWEVLAGVVLGPIDIPEEDHFCGFGWTGKRAAAPITQWRTPALQLLLSLAGESGGELEEPAASSWRRDLAAILERELGYALEGEVGLPSSGTGDDADIHELAFQRPSHMEHAAACILGLELLSRSAAGRKAVARHSGAAKMLCDAFVAMKPWRREGEEAAAGSPISSRGARHTWLGDAARGAQGSGRARLPQAGQAGLRVWDP